MSISGPTGIPSSRSSSISHVHISRGISVPQPRPMHIDTRGNVEGHHNHDW